MTHTLKNNLFNHSYLLSKIFDRHHNEVISTIDKLDGTNDEMLSQFFIELHIPLNHETYKIVHVISSKEQSNN